MEDCHHRHSSASASSSSASSSASLDLRPQPSANVAVSSTSHGITESNSTAQSVPGEVLAVGRSDASSSSSSSELSKSKQNSRLGVLAMKFFDEKIPLKKKLKWLKRTAMVKDDGTIQFEVPGDVEPQALDFGTGVVYNEAADAEPVDTTEVQDIPPLQIVMLIVGTRGDVQPFVAIGKCLQCCKRRFGQQDAIDIWKAIPFFLSGVYGEKNKMSKCFEGRKGDLNYEIEECILRSLHKWTKAMSPSPSSFLVF